MTAQLPERIILIGPSGSGKSELAGRLAAMLGYTTIDTDAEIVDCIEMPIARFFERCGERAFRALESSVIAEACSRSRVVIATGGGAVLSPANWIAWRPRSVIIGLSARPETLLMRVRQQAERDGVTAERPLLAGDAEARMVALLDSRSHLYQLADETIDTDWMSPSDVCEAALRIVKDAVASLLVPGFVLAGSGRRSDIFVQRRSFDSLPSIIRRRWPMARRLWIITDEHVAELQDARIQHLVERSDFDVRILSIPAGEASKSLCEVERICGAMTHGGVTRRDIVVAVGGGVVGDLAGFVASICLRGLGLVQVPTSLLAMVDSSVGGKTGVNMPAGKNLVGTFYQPDIVLIDPELLETLPLEEYRSGMAEIVKHSIIQPSTPLGGDELASLLETIRLDPVPVDMIERVLELNVAIKHSVVQTDERESGLRMILNFGHTAGHAIEADGYRYRHGEAVAIGMVVAARISRLLGRVGAEYVERVEGLVRRAALPTRVDGSATSIIGRMSSDKKHLDGSLRWILPTADGRVESVSPVPINIVKAALLEVGAR